jgi:FkbM family methyltransferase
MTMVRQLSRLAPIDMPVDGRKRERAFALIDPVARLLPMRNIPTSLGDMAIDWRSSTERSLSYFFYNTLRFYTRSELGRYIEKVAAPGHMFVDVGANLGIYSLIARLNGMDAVAVEPEPAHARFLKRNTHIFGNVLDIAMADAAGALPLYYHPGASGATSLAPAPGYVKGEGSVAVSTFSQAADSGDLGAKDKVRLVKIDVEGFEVEAVRGMAAFLGEGHRPDLWCEVRGTSSKRAPDTCIEVCRILEGYGYVAYATDDFRRFSAEDPLAQNNVFDLLFTTGGQPTANVAGI